MQTFMQVFCEHVSCNILDPNEVVIFVFVACSTALRWIPAVLHCFSVSEQMYGLIWLTDLRSKMDSVDLLIMLTSAVCHDLDHTGYNNAYQVH